MLLWRWVGVRTLRLDLVLDGMQEAHMGWLVGVWEL